jgi:hypothetical protein
VKPRLERRVVSYLYHFTGRGKKSREIPTTVSFCDTRSFRATSILVALKNLSSSLSFQPSLVRALLALAVYL